MKKSVEIKYKDTFKGRIYYVVFPTEVKNKLGKFKKRSSRVGFDKWKAEQIRWRLAYVLYNE